MQIHNMALMNCELKKVILYHKIGFDAPKTLVTKINWIKKYVCVT